MWRPVLLGVAGLLLVGPVLGFLLAFAVVGVGPRGNYGEMQGVAAISAGIMVGMPLGAVVFCALGVWLGLRLANRSSSKPIAPAETPPSGPAPSTD